MIDFRYHIVSIVSIFLALAVGILLGAGPLQEDLGKTLTSQVSTLRQDKADLRTQLDGVQRSVDASSRFATDVTPQLVSAQLGGYPIVVVTLPGADGDAVTELVSVLTAAGATVTGTVAVTTAWTDPATAAARAQLVGSLSAAGGDATTSLDTRMGAVLAGALVVDKLTEAGAATPASTQTLAALKQGDLLRFDGAGPAPATLAVVVAPTPDAKASADQRRDVLSGWLGLARGLDAAGRGTAVVGAPDSAASGGLLAAVRSDDAAAKVVSTVDDLSMPMGRIAAVYALREQVAGQAGQYGVGPGASAVLPALTAAGS